MAAGDGTQIRGGERAAAYIGRLMAQLGARAEVRVGFLEGSTEADGTSIPMIAAIQNFGAPSRGIPPRPFFSNMVAAKQDEWGPATAQALKAGMDAKTAMGRVGQGIAGQLRQSITDTNEPALSPVTLMLRKLRAKNPDLVVTGATVGEAARRVAAGEDYSGVSTKPLVDSGGLQNAVDYEVRS